MRVDAPLIGPASERSGCGELRRNSSAEMLVSLAWPVNPGQFPNKH